MITANLKQTGSQLLQLLLQLIPDLRQTLTLLVLQFQFLRCARETITTTFTRKDICIVNFFFRFCVCQQKVGCDTFLAASSCSLRISDPFSLISLSLTSSEELRSRERLPWSRPEVGPAWPPPSTLDSSSGSRSTNLCKSRDTISIDTNVTERFYIHYLDWVVIQTV